MIHALDHVIIAVSDLESARDSYTQILGRCPSWSGEHPGFGTANSLFRLANTYLELLAPAGPGAVADALRERLKSRGEGLFGLAFATDDADECAKRLRERGIAAADPVAGEGRESETGAERRWRNVHMPAKDTRGVLIFAIEHLSEPDTLPQAEPLAGAESAVEGLDHVVVMSRDAEATRALYGDALGLRLALDRSFPERGTRLLFFRVGGVTVEIGTQIDAEPQPDTPDELWGLAYRVPSVPRVCERLAQAGVDLSDVRVGRKPGTSVATVRDPTHGVPTLIIGPE
jgi:catechol 2,3-dioxygenase-like lactoylglutathione lyase family enzyme